MLLLILDNATKYY